ncbi:non-ribosomal peptide synthetase [Lacrimispora algidixylanolytica]|uniref:Carrier domain-containing protein n=1 Tax=Lacrimispora algidixylanolytica TaxID=94868 RepID=A0A419T1K8_9FIRM|nr:non-ribosomal peptide synthetase [Lacrimispora algidixylanolytica]RKD31342.1 hypothetical protein BET01_20710 [Lacrimispora algidixylanolytica]
MDKNLLATNYWKNEIKQSLNSEKIILSHFNDVTNRSAKYKMTIEGSTVIALNNICGNNKLLMYVFFVSVFNITLYKYFMENDFVVGIASYKGRLGKIENNILLPLVSELHEEYVYEDYMRNIKNKISNHYKYQDYLTSQSLLDSGVKEVLNIASANICMRELHSEKLIDLVCNSNQNELLFLFNSINKKCIELSVIYNDGRITSANINNICKTFKLILDTVITNHNIKIKDIELLSEVEKNKILQDFNITKTDYLKNVTVYELFEKQVKKTPDEIAVVFGDRKLNYRELNEKSNSLARILRNKGVKPNSIVGLKMERSLEMIIGIMGILKAGGAYLPIDPNYPIERIKYILRDSGCNIILTENGEKNESDFSGECIDLSNDDIFSEEVSNLNKVNCPNDMIYVIYTSGTTGEPKGTMVMHGSFTNLIEWYCVEFQISKEDNILLMASISFDLAQKNIYAPLLVGGKLILANKGLINYESVIGEIYNNKVTIINCAPSAFNPIVQLCSDRDFIRLKSLKYVFLGGEPINLKVLSDWTKSNYFNAEIVNTYGPTECTDIATFYRVSVSDNGAVPIGKPINNVKVYILDKTRKTRPIGVVGEVFISGVGVSRGYLHRPSITSEKFVDNPFDVGSKMYMTGDLAEWRSDGNIEFVGRIDDQIKIRGVRLEPGEIESRLLQHDDVQEAVVLARKGKDGEHYLCAYVVSEKVLCDLDLKTYLKEILPEYLVPSFFIQVEKMPLTGNGKVNKRMLPEPNSEVSIRNYEAPINKTEKDLAKIWCDVLDVDRVGRNDDFFELGGHSLKATILLSKIHHILNVEITIKSIFNNSTLHKMSKVIEDLSIVECKNIERVKEQEYYILSLNQKWMYTLQFHNQNSINYNISGAVKIEGALNIPKLELAFRQLINRHEILRTSFHALDSGIKQKVNKEVDFELIHYNAEEMNVMRIIKEFIKPFDLSKSPLIRGGIIEIVDNNSTCKKAIFIIDMHHIIADGITFKILIEEIISIYEDRELPELNIQYKDYAYWQNDRINMETFKKQEIYWLKYLEGKLPILDIPTDFVRPSVHDAKGDVIEIVMDKDLTEKINKLAYDTRTTLYMVLLSAFNILLYKYTGQNDIIIGTPVSGRNHVDLQNIMGIFVNTLAIRSNIDFNQNFQDFINDVKINVINAYENQEYPFEMIVEKMKIPKNLNLNPVYSVMFALQDPVNIKKEIGAANISEHKFSSAAAQVDLQIEAFEDNGNIRFKANYSTDLFKENTVNNMMMRLKKILNKIVENPTIKLGDIDILTTQERDQILCNYSNVEQVSDRYISLIQLFEKQVKRTPYNEAVVFENKVLTYQELHEKSNQIAHYLIAKGIKAGDAIGLQDKKSLETIVALLGILKAGGMYIPISTEFKTKKINQIIANSGCKIIIEGGEQLNKLTSLHSVKDVKLDMMSESAVCIIYTSEYTESPKGIIITQEVAVNSIININQRIMTNENSRIASLHSLCSEFSLYDVFGVLISGATLVQISDYNNIDKLCFNLDFNKIDILISTSVLMNRVISKLDNNYVNTNLRYLLLCDNWLPIRNSIALREHFINIRTITLGGVLEGSAWAIHYPFMKLKKTLNKLLLDNLRFFVLDVEKKLCPIGVRGELYIGYDETKVLENFKSETNSSLILNNKVDYLFKTGDYAVLRNNGEKNNKIYIELLGNNISQVTIKGYCVDKREIEACLRRFCQIKNAIVVTKMDMNGDEYLCAYIVADDSIDYIGLKTYLLGLLPFYMVPQEFMKIDRIPINDSGEINFAALQNMEINSNSEKKLDYISPITNTQMKLEEMWRTFFNIDRPLGIKDNFFDLGGHSLNAAFFISKLKKEMDTVLGIKELFQYPTIETLADYIDSITKLKESQIRKLEKKEFYECSSAQKRMFFINQIESASVAYNNPMCLRVIGNLKIDKLYEAIHLLIQRHEGLRTSFELHKGDVMQKVHEYVDLEIINSEAANSNYEKDFIKPFNLSKAPLFRVNIIKISYNEYRLLFDMHHIISDGISMWILVDDLVALYQNKSLETLSVQYKDYVVWQQEMRTAEAFKRQENYWLEMFKSEIPVINLHYDYSRPPMQSFEGAHLKYSLDSEIVNKLRMLCKQSGATLYMILLAALNVLFYKYTGQEDIIIGSPVAGRNHDDVKGIVGMFVNTLAMRNYPQGTKTFRDFVDEVKVNALNAYENQEYPLEVLLEKINIERDLSRNPLFDVVLVLQNMEPRELDTEDLKFLTYEIDNNISKFDIQITVEEKKYDLDIDITYCTKLFKEETIDSLYAHLNNIFNIVLENSNIQLQDIDLLSKNEKMQLLCEYSNTGIAYPSDMTINQLFEKQVLRVPNYTALIYENKTLTYRQLNERANQIARLLIQYGVGPDTVVGVVMNQSIELIVGIIGILKAGGAYLPVDPDFPVDRISYMFQDSDIRIILTQCEIKETLHFGGVSICLDDDDIYNGETTNLGKVCLPSNLAYIIYTSGTTGVPKGVMIEHKNVVSLLYNQNFQFDFSEHDIWTMFHSACFDFSVWEIFGALLYGGKSLIISKSVARNASNCLEVIKKHNVTVLNQTPSAFYNLISEEMKTNVKQLNLKYVIFGGETLKTLMLKEWKRKYPNIKLINMYGITETTVHVTYHEVTDLDIQTELSNIGKPLPTTSVYILDKNKKLLPVGAVGEMYIGGSGVARGYLNSDSLTAERFIKSPFEFEERLYQSGDLACYLPDGNIEYLGRADNQVKVRGFRIELGEIENCLLKHENINEAIVIIRERSSKDKYLCAYIVVNETVSATALKNYLSTFLPSYMVPSYFVEMDKLPQTSNGKVDTKKLPIPLGNSVEGTMIATPKSDTEIVLSNIWKKVLEIEIVDCNENFFDLGGNSLLVLRLFDEIAKNYPNKISIADVFSYPTITKLAEFIDVNRYHNKDIVLSFVKFPDKYFSYSNNESSVIKFSVTGKYYKGIKILGETAHTDTYTVLLAFFSYIISHAAETSYVCIQTMIDEQNVIEELNADIIKNENEFDLINKCKEDLQLKVGNRYNLEDLFKMRNSKSGNSILPLFYRKDLLLSKFMLTDIYDIILEVCDQEERIDFIFDYDACRLDGNKQEVLINSYINLITEVCNIS